MDVLSLVVHVIATVHPITLALWCFLIGAGFAWLASNTLRMIRTLRAQRRREAAFLDREGRA